MSSPKPPRCYNCGTLATGDTRCANTSCNQPLCHRFLKGPDCHTKPGPNKLSMDTLCNTTRCGFTPRDLPDGSDPPPPPTGIAHIASPQPTALGSGQQSIPTPPSQQQTTAAAAEGGSAPTPLTPMRQLPAAVCTACKTPVSDDAACSRCRRPICRLTDCSSGFDYVEDDNQEGSLCGTTDCAAATTNLSRAPAIPAQPPAPAHSAALPPPTIMQPAAPMASAAAEGTPPLQSITVLEADADDGPMDSDERRLRDITSGASPTRLFWLNVASHLAPLTEEQVQHMALLRARKSEEDATAYYLDRIRPAPGVSRYAPSAPPPAAHCVTVAIQFNRLFPSDQALHALMIQTDTYISYRIPQGPYAPHRFVPSWHTRSPEDTQWEAYKRLTRLPPSTPARPAVPPRVEAAATLPQPRPAAVPSGHPLERRGRPRSPSPPHSQRASKRDNPWQRPVSQPRSDTSAGMHTSDRHLTTTDRPPSKRPHRSATPPRHDARPDRPSRRHDSTQGSPRKRSRSRTPSSDREGVRRGESRRRSTLERSPRKPPPRSPTPPTKLVACPQETTRPNGGSRDNSQRPPSVQPQPSVTTEQGTDSQRSGAPALIPSERPPRSASPLDDDDSPTRRNWRESERRQPPEQRPHKPEQPSEHSSHYHAAITGKPPRQRTIFRNPLCRVK